MEYTIKELARLAGTTSRTLRHYEDLGLLTPARTGANGYRFYCDPEVLVLQRILLFRRVGMPLEQIRSVINAPQASPRAELAQHFESLRQERTRIDRLITTVEQTLNALEKGQPMDANDALDGFNSQYKEEVIQRWGHKAYADSSNWFESMSTQQKQEFTLSVAELNTAWVSCWESGTAADSANAQALAKQHVAWLSSIPGTPAHNGSPSQAFAYVEGLAHMYPADPRFAANYGGEQGAQFVRDALLVFIRASNEN